MGLVSSPGMALLNEVAVERHLKPHEVDTAAITRVVKLLLSKHDLAPNTVANALRGLTAHE
jgi:hypothetical protein